MSWWNPFAVDRKFVPKKDLRRLVPFPTTDPMFDITPTRGEGFVKKTIIIEPKYAETEAAVLIISSTLKNKLQNVGIMSDKTEPYAPIHVLKGRGDPLSRLGLMMFEKNFFYIKMHNLNVPVILTAIPQYKEEFKYQGYNVGGANITIYGPINIDRDTRNLTYYIVNDDTVTVKDYDDNVLDYRGMPIAGASGSAAPASGGAGSAAPAPIRPPTVFRSHTPVRSSSMGGGARLRTRSRSARTRSKSKRSKKSRRSRQRR